MRDAKALSEGQTDLRAWDDEKGVRHLTRLSMLRSKPQLFGVLHVIIGDPANYPPGDEQREELFNTLLEAQEYYSRLWTKTPRTYMPTKRAVRPQSAAVIRAASEGESSDTVLKKDLDRKSIKRTGHGASLAAPDDNGGVIAICRKRSCSRRIQASLSGNRYIRAP